MQKNGFWNMQPCKGGYKSMIGLSVRYCEWSVEIFWKNDLDTKIFINLIADDG